MARSKQSLKRKNSTEIGLVETLFPCSSRNGRAINTSLIDTSVKLITIKST